MGIRVLTFLLFLPWLCTPGVDDGDVHVHAGDDDSAC